MAVRDLDWESQDPPGSTNEDERGLEDDEEFGESDELDDDDEEEDEGDIGDEGSGHRG